jgi:hypothetical protein
MNRAAQSTSNAPAPWLHPLSFFIGLVLFVHGAIHLMGVVLLLELGEPGELTYADAWPEPGTALAVLFAILWARAAVLFAYGGFQMIRDRVLLWPVAIAAVVSVAAIAPVFSAAPAGLVLSVLALLGALVYGRRR